ncbi:lamin tail domain-containing protein, partial [Bacteroides thetaiotaomicron]|nr:lamin tail domain-containing protein [Bacteroides thetaiotaomicron]
LNPETANWDGLFYSGRKLHDQVVIPAGTLGPNQSYSRISDGAADWEVKGGSKYKYVTPSTNNKTLDCNAM